MIDDNSDGETENESQASLTLDNNGNTCPYNADPPPLQHSSTSDVNWNPANLDAMVVGCETTSPAVHGPGSVSWSRQCVHVLRHPKPSSDFLREGMLAVPEGFTCQPAAHVLHTEAPEHLCDDCHPPGDVQDQSVEPALPFVWEPGNDGNRAGRPAASELNQTFGWTEDRVTFITQHTTGGSPSSSTAGGPPPTSPADGGTPVLPCSAHTSSYPDKIRVSEKSHDRGTFAGSLDTSSEVPDTTCAVFPDGVMQMDIIAPDVEGQCPYSSGKVTSEHTDGIQQQLVGEPEIQALTPVSDSVAVPSGSVLQESFCWPQDEPDSKPHSQSSYGQKEMGQNLRETVSNCLIDDECPLLVPAFDTSQVQVRNPEHKVAVTEDTQVASSRQDLGTQHGTFGLTLSSPVEQKVTASFELSCSANDIITSARDTVCMSTPVLEPTDATFSLSPIEAAEKHSKVEGSNGELRKLRNFKETPTNASKTSLGKSATKTNTPVGSKVRKMEIISYPRPNFKNVKAKVISRPVLPSKDPALAKVTLRPQLTTASSPSSVSSSRQATALSKTPRSDLNADTKAEILINKMHKQQFNQLITNQAVRVTAHSKTASCKVPRATPAVKSNQEDADSSAGEPRSVATFFQKIKGILPVKMESTACLGVTYISNTDRISPGKKGEKGNGTLLEKQELKRELLNETFEYGSLFLGPAPRPAATSGRSVSKLDSSSLRKTPGPKAKVGPAVSCLRRNSENRNLNPDRALSPQRTRRVSSSGKPTSLKAAPPSWANLPRPLPKSKVSLKNSTLRRTRSTSSIATARSDQSVDSNNSGNATVIKYVEKTPKPASQNGSSGPLYLKPLVPRAHVHLLKTTLKGPSRKNVFTAFTSVEKGRQKNPRSLCTQTQTSPDVQATEKALELAQCKAKCDSQSGFILRLKQLLSCGNTKLEALAVVIQHLLSEREEALKQHKTLSQELVNLRGELVTASTTCEKLEKARSELQLAYEGFVQKLNQQHQTDLTELENRLKEFYTGECEKLQHIYIEEAEKYKMQLQEQFDNLNAAHETSKLEMEASHSEKVELLRKAYETALSEIKKNHEMEKKSLEDLLYEKQESLEKQISDLKSENDTLYEKLNSEEQKRLSREKANVKNPQLMYLEQELESLKAVLEIKNEKLHQQDVQLMKMEKLVDNNTALVDRLKRFQQENEELRARMDKHMAISRQLSSEQAVLQESLEKESKVNKRLSMENEELLWKLHNGDLCSPKRSPTSSAIPFQSPRNSGSFSSPSVSPR